MESSYYTESQMAPDLPMLPGCLSERLGMPPRTYDEMLEKFDVAKRP